MDQELANKLYHTISNQLDAKGISELNEKVVAEEFMVAINDMSLGQKSKEELQDLFAGVFRTLKSAPSLPPPSLPTPVATTSNENNVPTISYQYDGIPGIDVSQLTEDTTTLYTEILDDEGLVEADEKIKEQAMFKAFMVAGPAQVGGVDAASEAEWFSLFHMVQSWAEGYGVLTPLLEDKRVTEIMVNGPKEIWVENEDGMVLTDLFFTDGDSLKRILSKIAASVGRRIDDQSPILDARLPDKSRVNATLDSITMNGHSLTVRKFPEESITVDQLIEWGSLTPQAAKFVELCVLAACNILVSGGTGSGKTTMLNALGNYIPLEARIISIEDVAELQLQHPHVLRHESRNANLEGEGGIDMGDLLEAALRQRPDRIIVGEVRGGEAADMLQAMNTGHDGSMSTIHANDSAATLKRLNSLVLQGGSNMGEHAINTLIADALHLIVYCGKVPIKDGNGKAKRMVTAITEVQNMEGNIILTQDIFVAKPVNGNYYLLPTGMQPSFKENKFFMNGIVAEPSLFLPDENNEALKADRAVESTELLNRMTI